MTIDQFDIVYLPLPGSSLRLDNLSDVIRAQELRLLGFATWRIADRASMVHYGDDGIGFRFQVNAGEYYDLSEAQKRSFYHFATELASHIDAAVVLQFYDSMDEELAETISDFSLKNDITWYYRHNVLKLFVRRGVYTTSMGILALDRWKGGEYQEYVIGFDYENMEIPNS